MDWKFLFTSMDGRIGRKQFWLGVIVLIIAAIVLSFIVGAVIGGGAFMSMMGNGGGVDAATAMHMNSLSGWSSLIIFVVLAYPGLCVSLKRRHDRGSAGRLVWVSYGLSLLTILLQITGIGYSVQDMGGMPVVTPGVIGMVIGLASAVIGIYLLVVMGFLKGDSGDNAYGPDPLA